MDGGCVLITELAAPCTQDVNWSPSIIHIQARTLGVGILNDLESIRLIIFILVFLLFLLLKA